MSRHIMTLTCMYESILWKIFTFKRGINVLYHKQDTFWRLKFDSFKHYVCISPGVRGGRSLQGLGAEAGTGVTRYGE